MCVYRLPCTFPVVNIFVPLPVPKGTPASVWMWSRYWILMFLSASHNYFVLRTNAKEGVWLHEMHSFWEKQTFKYVEVWILVTLYSYLSGTLSTSFEIIMRKRLCWTRASFWFPKIVDIFPSFSQTWCAANAYLNYQSSLWQTFMTTW